MSARALAAEEGRGKNSQTKRRENKTRYIPEEEILVLRSIKDLGQATRGEILEYLKDHYSQELEYIRNKYNLKRDIDSKLLDRIIKRWEKRKVITTSIVQKMRTYFLMDIPWLGRLQMMHVTGVTGEDAKEFLKSLEKSAKEAKSSKGPLYADYVSGKFIFELLDDVAGGDRGKEEGHLYFPRDRDGAPCIKVNWMYAYLRDNIRLVNESSLPKYLGLSPGTFLEKPETVFKEARVKVGHTQYEVVEPGAQFETYQRWPLKGFENIKSMEDIKTFYDLCAVAPIRGLGAYSRNFGGRIKLLEVK